MEATYYGHSCFNLDTGEANLLIDPFITPNPLAAHVDVANLEADAVLLTHGHMDHMADAEDIVKRSGATLVCNYEIGNWYAAKDINTLSQVNQGGSVQINDAQVKYVNAIHSSSLPDGSYGGNPGGFIIKTGEKTVYHAGDTALMMDMELFGRQERFDVALLPIGDVFTMGVTDAILAAEMLKCERVVGMHYDTFPPIEIDKEAAKQAFAKAGIELILMEIGSSITI